jgi:hypothetical protein
MWWVRKGTRKNTKNTKDYSNSVATVYVRLPSADQENSFDAIKYPLVRLSTTVLEFKNMIERAFHDRIHTSLQNTMEASSTYHRNKTLENHRFFLTNMTVGTDDTVIYDNRSAILMANQTKPLGHYLFNRNNSVLEFTYCDPSSYRTDGKQLSNLKAMFNDIKAKKKSETFDYSRGHDRLGAEQELTQKLKNGHWCYFTQQELDFLESDVQELLNKKQTVDKALVDMFKEDENYKRIARYNGDDGKKRTSASTILNNLITIANYADMLTNDSRAKVQDYLKSLYSNPPQIEYFKTTNLSKRLQSGLEKGIRLYDMVQDDFVSKLTSKHH